jgi:hypothetical protein
MRFACRLTKARIQTHIHNIEYLFLHIWLIPSNLVKCFTAKLTKIEKLCSDLSAITNCLAKWLYKEDLEQTNIIFTIPIFTE